MSTMIAPGLFVEATETIDMPNHAIGLEHGGRVGWGRYFHTLKSYETRLDLFNDLSSGGFLLSNVSPTLNIFVGRDVVTPKWLSASTEAGLSHKSVYVLGFGPVDPTVREQAIGWAGSWADSTWGSTSVVSGLHINVITEKV